MLKSAVRVALNKSYRSSWEIMQFALAISPNPDLIAMERHDALPQILTLPIRVKALDRIADEIAAFSASDPPIWQ